MPEKHSSTMTVTMPTDREILVTRTINAPRALVFKAYTDPVMIPQWWGPRQYTTVVEKMDVRPGGAWRFVQHDKDGTEYAFNGVFREIVPPERLVQTFEFEGEPGHLSVETATFEERDGKTLVTLRSVFQNKADRDGMVNAGMESGLRDSLDRLEELTGALAAYPTEPSSPGEIVITRTFDAPRARVWQAWTEPQHLMRWWGPKDYTAPACKVDLRAGGKYLFCMRSPEGRDFWSTGVYREIVPMERIVYTDSFADAEGNVVPPSKYGMPADMPEELVVTVTFEDQGSKTKMTLRHSFPAGTMGDLTRAGWQQSFDKMEASFKQPGTRPGASREASTTA